MSDGRAGPTRPDNTRADLTVFTTAYLVEVAVRLTYTVATAREVAAGAPVDDTFPHKMLPLIGWLRGRRAERRRSRR
jgi:hypothetical protein